MYKVGRGPDWADVGVARRLVAQYRAFLAILLVREADRDRVGLYKGVIDLKSLTTDLA